MLFSSNSYRYQKCQKHYLLGSKFDTQKDNFEVFKYFQVIIIVTIKTKT